jgi:hypothetical protein
MSFANLTLTDHYYFFFRSSYFFVTLLLSFLSCCHSFPFVLCYLLSTLYTVYVYVTSTAGGMRFYYVLLH